MSAGLPLPESPGSAPGLESVLQAVRVALPPSVETLHLVGGAVRDQLLERPFRDLDLVLCGPLAATAAVAGALSRREGWSRIAVHARFGTASLEAPGEFRVDLATARRESYPRPGALPVVEAGVPLHEDLSRRDFTVHALARPVEPDGSLGPLVDPFGGRADLAAGRLRLLHEGSLADDPTRAIRAGRYAARLGFTIEEDGFGRSLDRSRSAGSWATISGDRLRRALEEVLSEPRFREAIGLLVRLGVLAEIHPALERARPPGPEAPDATIAGRWRALLESLGEEERAGVAQRLRFSRSLLRAVGSGA